MDPLVLFGAIEQWVFNIFYIEAFAMAVMIGCFSYLKFKNTVLAARVKTEYSQIVAELVKVILNPNSIEDEDLGRLSLSKKADKKLVVRALLELHHKVSAEKKPTVKHIYIWLGLLAQDHKCFGSYAKYNRLRAFLNAEIIGSETSIPHFVRRFRRERDPLLRAACARALIRLNYKGDLQPLFEAIFESRRFDSIVEVLSFLAANRMDVFKRLYSQADDWMQKTEMKLYLLKVIVQDEHVEAVKMVKRDLRDILDSKRAVDPMLIKTMFLCLNLEPDAEAVQLLEECRYYEDDEISFLALCALQKIRPETKSLLGQFLVSNDKAQYLSLFEKHASQVATLSYG